MNYGDLKTLILTNTHRADLSAVVGGFVAQAEDMLARGLRPAEWVTRVTLDESDRDTGGIYDLPADFLEARALSGTGTSGTYLLKPVSFAEFHAYPTSGNPSVYTTYSRKIEIRATPSTDTEFTLIYFARPAAFSADGDTSDLLTNHHTIYLYASMIALYDYTQDIELRDRAASQYDAMKESLNAQADRQRGGNGVGPAFNFGLITGCGVM